jgi:hypothetical protein
LITDFIFELDEIVVCGHDIAPVVRLAPFPTAYSSADVRLHGRNGAWQAAQYRLVA